MLFQSVSFLIFFPVVVLLYFCIPASWKKWKNVFLLAASYYFYMAWNPQYLIFVLFSTGTTFISGLWIQKGIRRQETAESPASAIWMKKSGVAFAAISNLLVLVFFKYFDFIFENLNAALAFTGVRFAVPEFDILLPIGISFYTFQAIGYTVDVYRKKIKAEKNLLNYALFIGFFPQLSSGPIGRSTELLGQFSEIHKFDFERLCAGLQRMIWGFIQKLVIADRLAILVNTVFDQYEYFGTIELLIGAVFFTIQIYCDFAGYTNIAIGAAEIMGFRLAENFRQPYFAGSIKEFWGRWHISLSTWFRDYLYIPMGGNRKGRIRKHFNVMVVFLVSGLWHGANWTFLVWGGLHGLYQIIGEVLRPLKNRANKKAKINTQCFSWRAGKCFTTFLLVAFAWIFFRSDSLAQAFGYIGRMFTVFNPWALFDKSLYAIGLNSVEFWIALFAVAGLFVVDLLKERGMSIRQKLQTQNLWFRWAVEIGAIVLILVYGIYGPAYDASAFLYFQF